MAIEKNIKKENRKYLIGFLTLNVVLFLFLSKTKGIESFDPSNILSQLLNPKHLVLVATLVLSLILEGVISSNLKAMLVFCRIKNPLPGTRAFSTILAKDQRIDVEKLKKFFSGKFPVSPDEQNREWYKLYRKYSAKEQVIDAHKSFLLTRDIAALSLILIPLIIAGYLIYNVPWIKISGHIGLLLFVLVTASSASRNYGNRFVANVLVETTQE